MSIVQSPKKSWLAEKSACSLVLDASLGLQLPPSALAALTCLSLVGGGLVRSPLALLCPLFCERAWRRLEGGEEVVKSLSPVRLFATPWTVA